MPSTEIPENYVLVGDGNALKAGQPTINIEISKPKKESTNNSLCNFGIPEVHQITLTQVYLEQEDIDAGWRLGDLVHLNFHCRERYNSEINPDLKFKF